MAAALDPIAGNGLDIPLAVGTVTNTASGALGQVSEAMQQAASVIIPAIIPTIKETLPVLRNGPEPSTHVVSEVSGER